MSIALPQSVPALFLQLVVVVPNHHILSDVFHHEPHENKTFDEGDNEQQGEHNGERHKYPLLLKTSLWSLKGIPSINKAPTSLCNRGGGEK